MATFRKDIGTTAAAPPPAPPAPARVGPLAAGVAEAGELTRFAIDTFRQLPGSLRYSSELLRQAAILVRGATPFIFMLAFFLGVTATNFAYFFLKSIGGTDALGVASGFLDPRNVTPIIFGYAFAAKVAGAITAEIGSMNVQQEVQALESTGVSRMHYIVGTRVGAAILYMPVAATVCLAGATFGSWFDATQILSGITSGNLLSLHWSVQTVSDQVFAAINIFFQGVVMTIVACFYGFRAVAGPVSVGSAVARSLMVNLIVVHIIDGCLLVFFYGTDTRFPIGG